MPKIIPNASVGNPPTSGDISDITWVHWFQTVFKALSSTSILDLSGFLVKKGEVSTHLYSNTTYRKVTKKAVNYNMVEEDCIILADATAGNITIMLPFANLGAAGFTCRKTVKRLDGTANVVTVSCPTGNLIDGAATTTVAASKSKDFDSDGTSNWYTVGIS